jgi:hypothetical protein
MVTALIVIAKILSCFGVILAIWSASCRQPRLMTGALGLTASSLVYGAGGAAYQHHYETVVLGGVGAVLICAVMWRCWPDGWNPYREFRNAVVSGRLGGL